jgi:EAL domain-containing protein (putative c-di-GMP-specific phosphodiesterase class I)
LPEHVEPGAHVRLLSTLGVQHAQGFLDSRPLDAAAFELLLDARRVLIQV